MRKLFWLVLLMVGLGGSAFGQTYQKIQGYCERGGETVTTDGRTSTTKVQRSYPSCTITVYDTGTTNLASIASNSSGTPKSNPFTADSDGYWFWYALEGEYDVKMSGGGLASPITRSGYWITDPGGGGGGGITGSGTTNRFPIFTSSTAIGNSVFQQVGVSEFTPIATGKRINLGTGSQQTVEIANASVGGTTQNRIAKLTGAPSTAITATTSDTTKLIGIVAAGAGTTGSAQIVTNGNIACDFDGATTAGNYVGASTSSAGKCTDLGSSLPSSGVQVLGRVLSTIGSAGSADVYVFTGEQGRAGIDGSGTTNYLAYWTDSNTLAATNALFSIADSKFQFGYSVDIANGGLSELTLETDQIIFKGGVSRANNAIMQAMKATASQTGAFQRFTTSAGSVRFEVDIDGDMKARGVNYTWPSTLPASTGCLQITTGGVMSVVPCVTGSVTFEVQAYNVKNDGGCVGDGVTNDTSCVAAAYTAANSAARPLYFPTGTYLIDAGTITIATNGLTIFGDGPGKTFLQSRTGTTGLILIDASAVNPHSITIRDMTLTGAGSGASNHGIYVTGSNTPFNMQFKNLRIDGFTGIGIYDISGMFQSRIDNVVVSMAATGGNGIDLLGSNDFILQNNYVTVVGSNSVAYRFHSGRPTFISNNGINPGITNGSWGVFGDNLAEDGADRYVFATLIGNNIEDFTQYGLRFKSGSYASFWGNSLIAPASGVVTPIKWDFVDTGQRGIWDATNSIQTQGATYTNSNALNSRGAPFAQIGGTSFTSYYDTTLASSITFPYISPTLVAGSTNIAMLISRAQITTLEASSLSGDFTGTTDFAGNASRTLLQDGTAARPTRSFVSDTNTGFYRSGADIIGFAAGGVEAATLSSTALTLGRSSGAAGAITLYNASNAFTTTIQSGAAAASRTYTWPTNFGSAGAVLTDSAGNGTLSWAVPSTTPSLTATYVGYGSGSNLLTGTSDLTYNTSTKVLTVSTGTGVPYLYLNGGSDAAGVKINAGSHPGNGGGLILPFVGGGMSTGPGVWWCAGAYVSCSGLYINNGLTYQGASSTHDKFKLAEGTGTSSNGTVRYMWEPSSSLLTQTLSTSTTAAAHIMEDTTVTSTGTAAANFGVRENTTIENASGSNVLAVGVEKVWTVATAGAETARVEFVVRNQGSSAARSFTIDGLQNYATVSNLGNKSGSFTVDFSLGNYVTMTATGNFTTVTFSNIKAGAKYVLKITQNGTGGNTWTPPTTFKYPGGIAGNILTGTANAVDVFICETFDTTNLWCNGLFDVKNP